LENATVRVTVNGDTHEYITDVNGQVVITKAEFGTYSVTASYSGYNNGTASVTISQTSPAGNLNIALGKTKTSGGGGGGGGGAPAPTPTPALEPEEPETTGTEHTAYISGYPDGTVRPHGSLTRAEAATVFYRLLGEPEVILHNAFGDVKPDTDWFYKAVASMTALGLVNGYPDGTFRPNATITRAELTKMVKAFADYTHLEQRDKGIAVTLSDVGGHWASDYIIHGARVGWISGYPDSTFRPDAAINRAEFVALLNRMLGRDPVNESDHLSSGIYHWKDNTDRSEWYYLDIMEASNSHIHSPNK
jgi:hypothetical protein